MSNGRFFERRPVSDEGRFLRDLPGRDEGDFHKKANSSYGPGIGAATSGMMGGSMNVSPGGGMGGAQGNMYGAGTGMKPAAPASPPKPVTTKPTTAAMPKAKSHTKQALETGSLSLDEGLDESLPYGFHRPAREQPEALEFGGERFHDSHVYGSGDGAALKHGTLEAGGGIKAGVLASPQLGKHASDMRFMGTSFQKVALPQVDWQGAAEKARAGAEGVGEYGKRVGSKAWDTTGETLSQAGGTLKGGLEEAAATPLGAAAILGGTALGAKHVIGGAAKAGGKGLAGAGRLIGIGRKAEKARELGMLAKAMKFLRL